MNYSFSISTRKGDEYRIILTVIINGEGYCQFMHLIARNKHQTIVDIIKNDVLEGWGK